MGKNSILIRNMLQFEYIYTFENDKYITVKDEKRKKSKHKTFLLKKKTLNISFFFLNSERKL